MKKIAALLLALLMLFACALAEGFPVTVTDQAGRTVTVQAVSVGGGRIRVSNLDGVDVDFTGEYNTIIVRHLDVPGELATLTREISNAKINIANMSLVRSKRGGDVMTIFEIDNPAPADIIKQLRVIPCVENVTYYQKEVD